MGNRHFKKKRAVKKLKIGVLGLGRGFSFVYLCRNNPSLNMEVVAICDKNEKKLKEAKKTLEVETYTDYDKFLQHDMDAVIIANYFHQHAPFAIKALKANKNVLSETSACFTLKEGVELIETVEKTKKIYMFAENYPYMLFNLEMQKLYKNGEIGEFRYGEGEYVHPMDPVFSNRISPGVNHWRNWLPATYYCTHSLAPIMVITDTYPVKVNGFIFPADFEDEIHYGKTARVNDLFSCIILRMNNNAIVKLLQISLRGEGHWVRIHGTKGLMENLRFGDRNMVRIRKEPFDKKQDEPVEKIYLPEFPSYLKNAIGATHGGGDFVILYLFGEAIREEKQPYLDVYKGVWMSIVGILAYRSALDNSNTYEIPDLRKKQERDKYRNDDWNPDPERHKKGYPYPSILGKLKPSKEGLKFAKKIW